MAELENGSRASYYVPDCKRLRMDIGHSINDLSRETGLDRGTISRIERMSPVTELTAKRVFNALNKWHRGILKEGTVIISKLTP